MICVNAKYNHNITTAPKMDLVTQNITTAPKYNQGVASRLVCAENHKIADYSIFTVYMAHTHAAEGSA